ncbi:hypothetical protein ACLI4Q_07040 [Natrialbaceae archaeon A-CW1-1]
MEDKTTFEETIKKVVNGIEPANDVHKLRNREPGEHETNPYENVDISNLPEWWQEGIELHRKFGLRPYLPPRFQDGTIKYEITEELEDKYGITIRFKAVNPEESNKWNVVVDNENIETVTRRRDTRGFSVFEINSDEFRSLIQRNIVSEDSVAKGTDS